MKNFKKNIFKNTNGITLIALVISVIVLLILAGISVSMLSGDNSILNKATLARNKTEKSQDIEQIQIAYLVAISGNYVEGNDISSTLELELEKTYGSGKVSVTKDVNNYKVDIEGKGNFTIDANGNIEKSLITINSSSIQITAEDGSAITKGEVEQGTKLKISNLSASIEGGSVTISPTLPHVTTTEEMNSKKVVFTLTGVVNGETAATTTYTLDLKDIYKSSIVSMEELKAKASTYWGWDILNYAETLPIIDKGTANEKDYTQTKWQLFFAGSLEIDEDIATTLGLNEVEWSEERIWLISKDYVKNTLLPSKNGVAPILTDGSDYQAKFSTFQSNATNINDGILPQYKNGSNLITQTKLTKLNSKYFNYLTTNNTSSINPNMMAVAYMLDTDIWSPFSTSNKGYGDYAIGEPTIELLFTAYNKYKGTTFETQVTEKNGYQLRKNSTETFANNISNAFENDTNMIDNPYSVSNLGDRYAFGYWLASPSGVDTNNVIYVDRFGSVYFGNNGYGSTYGGFRPLICLNSNYTLEKTKDSNGKDAFNIVEK